MSELYPIMLKLHGRVVVVIGGGAVGRRKVAGLGESGADIRVVDPAGGDWPDGVEVIAEPYRPEHLAGATLAFACTDDPQTNARIAADASAAGVWVNVADSPKACDFTTPAVHRTDASTVAVATDAGTPALAGYLRDLCAAAMPVDLDGFAQALQVVRQRAKVDLPTDRRGEFLRRMSGSAGHRIYREGGAAALQAELDKVMG